MHTLCLNRPAAVLAVLGFLAGIASAADFSFTGTFSTDDQLQVFTFKVDTTSTILMRTWGYAGGTNVAGQVISRGGFDPVLSLFDSTGMLIGLNEDGTGFVAPDPNTGAAFDSYLTRILTPGTYTLVLTQSDNSPNGPTFADGFHEQGNPNFTAMFACTNGRFCDVTTDNRNGNWAVDIDNVAAAIFPNGAYAVKYASNLNIGDSAINLSNSGAATVAGSPSDICANVYAFAPDEQEISCCSCLITPNGLNSLSVRNDLVQTSLTGAVPTSVVVKLIATAPVGGTCNPAAPGVTALGLLAWGATIHAASTAPASYQVTETEFLPATLSVAEQNRDVTECQFIQVLGSGNFGICKSCKTGGLGAAAK
jgi:hypothetical protein